MQDAIAKEVGEFHTKLGLCRYRKVIDGKIHCKKKNETYNFNNSCMGCEFLPKLPKIASLDEYFKISMTDKILKSIEELETFLHQADQLNQIMQQGICKGLIVGETLEENMNRQIDIDRCCEHLGKIKNYVKKW